MPGYRFCLVAVAAVSLAACSSRPREFVATPASIPTDQAKYLADHETCRTLVAQGVRSGFGARMASGGLGAAASVGLTAAAVGGVASSGAAGPWRPRARRP